MVYCQLQALYSRQCVLKLFLYILFIICEFSAQIFTNRFGFFLIPDRFDPPENHYAVHIQRPFPFFSEAGVIYTIAYPVAIFDCINFVPCLCAMEIQFPIFRVVPMVHGNPIRIPVLPNHREHSPPLFPKNPDALLFTDFLFKPAHWSECSGPEFLVCLRLHGLRRHFHYFDPCSVRIMRPEHPAL